jgi:hypothetical protein
VPIDARMPAMSITTTSSNRVKPFDLRIYTHLWRGED